MRRSTRSMLVATTVPGTAKAFLLPYAEHFRGQGWTVDLATGPGRLDESVTKSFDGVHTIPWGRSLRSPLGAITAMWSIRRLIADNSYDLVHTHTPVASLLTRLAVRALPAKQRPIVVYTAHGFHFHPHGSSRSNAIFAALERLGGRWTDLLIVINDEDFRQGLRRRIVPANRLVHLPGIGVDLDYFKPTPEFVEAGKKYRADLGIPEEAVVFSMLAEFTARKNHRVAVEAIRLLPEPRPFLLLAGSGPLEEAVRQQIVEAGVSHVVKLLGVVRETRPLFMASDATVLPSSREGLCRAVLESLAMGVPVVGGASRGVAELIDDKSGIVVDPNDAQALAGALRDVHRIEGRGAMRPSVEERMEQYALGTVVARHDELYAALLERTTR